MDAQLARLAKATAKRAGEAGKPWSVVIKTRAAIPYQDSHPFQLISKL